MAEVFLHRDRIWITTVLVVTVALCWVWIVTMARDMYGPMTGAAAWMMKDRWDFPYLVLLFAMWVVMMAAMMLPSLVPMLLRYRRAVGGTGETRLGRLTAIVGAAYFLVWTVFGAAAYPLGIALAAIEMRLPVLARGAPTARYAAKHGVHHA